MKVKLQLFKRGWHGVLSNAFYLPDVYTFENVWIKIFIHHGQILIILISRKQI